MTQTTLNELKDLWFRLSLRYPDKCVSIELPGGKPRIVIE
jgi:hypothetical protein